MIVIPRITKPEFTKDVPLQVIETNDNTGYVKAYGSIFGNEDEAGEIVDPGAFVKSLERRKIRRVWQHDHKMPVGKLLSAVEDMNGLLFETQYNLKTFWGKNAYHAVKHGDVDSFSIGYNEVKAKNYTDDNGVKHLGEIDLREISDVTFPANPEATVVEVKGSKSTEVEAPEPTEPEIELETKAGRTISAATRAQLIAARDAINALIGPEPESKPEPEKAVEPDLTDWDNTTDTGSEIEFQSKGIELQAIISKIKHIKEILG